MSEFNMKDSKEFKDSTVQLILKDPGTVAMVLS